MAEQENEYGDELPPGPFVKIYGSITRSSIWLESNGTRILWFFLLAEADQNGNVEGSVRTIAHQANITVEECVEGLRVLESPDPDSKNKDFEGRRIRSYPNGWHILNFRRYREMRTPEQIRTAERVRRHREKLKGETEAEPRVTGVTVTPEGEGEGEVEGDKKPAAVVERPSDNPQPPVENPTAQEAVAEALSGLFQPSESADPIREGKSDRQRVLELTVALNKGMHDNPALGVNVNPALPNSGHALTAAQQIAEMGIEHKWAVRATYAIAKNYKPEKPGQGIGSIAYTAKMLERPWQREAARRAAVAAPRPAETETDLPSTNGANPHPGPGNATKSVTVAGRDLKGEAILVWGGLKTGVRTRKVQERGARPFQLPRETDEEYQGRLDQWERGEVISGPMREIREIDPKVLEALSPAARKALDAIGGEKVVTHPTDSKGLDTLVWQFAAAYAAAVQAEGK